MIELRNYMGVAERVMVIAPHPDDDSLGTGGALMWAASTRTPARIVFLTSGENNPWSQRATELCWRMTPDAQRRWGERRRLEAIAALSRLGLSPQAARFLGFPDQRLTDLLIRDGGTALGRLAQEIAAWRPTVVFVPSLADRHPDHSATAILAHMAIARASGLVRRPRVLSFVIHALGRPRCGPACALVLSEPERTAKRQAILCHASQLRLRGGYMLRFAEVPERFEIEPFIAPVKETGHPLRLVHASSARWSFAIRRSLRIALGSAALLLVSQSDGDPAALRVELPRRDALRPLFDPDGREIVGEARTNTSDGEWHVTIDSPLLKLGEHCLARLDITRERRLGFFDSWSWLSFGRPARVHAQSIPDRAVLNVAAALQPSQEEEVVVIARE